ncbi:hypothetical protein KA005_51175 [bacterium]|nr:hypothetical protein [bacterium]
MNNFMKGLIIVLFIIGILLCIYFISSGDLTGREGSLISIILSIFSILATWIVTHLYSESQHKKAIEDVQEFHRTNLQTYARKAAEKCNNLSNELSRLSVYIYNELDRSDIENVNDLLLSREERMSSAIHIVNTLKSVNDTALSDWEGVIGEFLDKQREEKEEQEEEIRDLIERLQDVSEIQYDSSRESHERTETLKQELNALRKDMRVVIANLGISQFQLRKPKRKTKEDISIPCIDCNKPIAYQQRPIASGYKSIECPSCNAQLISFYNQRQGFYLEHKKDLTENITCPECEATLTCSLSNLPGSAKDLTCDNCKSDLRISRTIKKVNVKRKGPIPVKKIAKKIKDEDLQTVKNLLPEQPWPKGVHKLVAEKSGLTNETVHRAIQELIKKGVFKPQIDGKLFVPEPTLSTDST